ncbi:hypothetical protein PM082_023825 [Marasmius tenuissimus]|nr:hypothetical protein PM082_023825 [Marasmius tenuissimus]
MSTETAENRNGGNNSPSGGTLSLTGPPVPLPTEGGSRADTSENWRAGHDEDVSTHSATPTQSVSKDNGKHVESLVPDLDTVIAQSRASPRHSGFNPRVDPYSGLHAHATGSGPTGQASGSGHQYMSAFGNPDVTVGQFADQSVNWNQGRPLSDVLNMMDIM